MNRKSIEKSVKSKVQKPIIKKTTIKTTVGGSSKRIIDIKQYDTYTKSELLDLLKNECFRGNNGPGDDYIADFAIQWHKLHDETQYQTDIFKSPIAQGMRFVSNVKQVNGSVEFVLAKGVLYVKHTTKNKIIRYKISGLSKSDVSKFTSVWRKK